MPQEIESFDSGSNYKFGDKIQVNHPGQSLFDLSHLITTTIDNAGVLQTLNWLKTIPGDKMSVTAEGLLRVLAQKVPLYSRQRLYLYSFNVRYWDVWENAHVFVTKGFAGDENVIMPTFNDSNMTADSDGLGIQPGSLGDMLGLPLGMTRSQIIGAGVSCLCAYALLRIKRDYFLNKHFYKNDRVLLPNNDADFRCDDNGLLISATKESKYFKFDLFSGPGSTYYHKDITYDSGSSTYVMGVPYHEYPLDYFTSALDSPQHGEPVPLDYTDNGSLDFSDVFQKYDSQLQAPTGLYTQTMYELQFGDSKNLYPADTSNSSNAWAESHDKSKLWIDTFNKAKVKNLNLKIYLEDLRKQSINETILEQLAKTDGSYAEFTLNQFGKVARSSQDFKPLLIGSTYQNIVFTEVLQTAPSQQVVPGDTPSYKNTVLGEYAGHGITGLNNNFMGNFESDDYGMMFFIATIMPDIYYCQGLSRKFTDLTQEDLPLPDRCKLGMQPIKNQELFYAGNNSSSVGGDQYLWAYQDYGDEYRYERNRISGKIADPNNNSFFPYTQARLLASLPNWSKEFALATDVRKDYLAGGSIEVAYTAQFKFGIQAVRSLPYRAIPASLV